MDDEPAGDPWRQRLAPIAAAIVLVGGIAFLVFRSGSGEGTVPAASDGPSVATAPEPDEPRLETTVPPAPTAPPLVETTTKPTPSTDATTSTTTEAPPTTVVDATTAAPTQADIDAALLRLDDIDGVWTEEVVDTDTICADNPELDQIVLRGAVLFQQLNADPIGVRLMGHTILSFPDAATAERAFTADVEILEACSGTTIDVRGVQYRVQVTSTAFDDEQAATFPCSDQNAFLTIQLTNDAADVPYIAESGFSFRCGRNISVTSLATTIDLNDLDQDAFFAAGAIANTRAAALPGSR